MSYSCDGVFVYVLLRETTITRQTRRNPSGTRHYDITACRSRPSLAVALGVRVTNKTRGRLLIRSARGNVSGVRGKSLRKPTRMANKQTGRSVPFRRLLEVFFFLFLIRDLKTNRRNNSLHVKTDKIQTKRNPN